MCAAGFLGALLVIVPAPARATSVLPPVECTITGTSGPDVLRGTPGRDVTCGEGGDDTLIGLAGDDILRGGPGADRLVGRSGNDILTGGPGTDRGSGGRGEDACSADPAFIGWVVDTKAPELVGKKVPDTVSAGAALVVSWSAIGDSLSLRWELSDPSGVLYTEAWVYTPEYSLVG